jgi:hypothetical protein
MLDQHEHCPAAVDGWLEAAPFSTGDQCRAAFIQNRRGHHELGVDIDLRHRLRAIFTELAQAI